MTTGQQGVHEEEPPLIVLPGEGHRHPGPFSNLTVKVSGESTHGMYSLHEEVIQPGEGGPPVHTHIDQEEAFYIAEGELTMVVGKEIITAKAGTFVLVPAGWRHGFANRSEGVVRALGIFSPRGFDEGFEELGAAIARGARGEEMQKLSEKWGTYITGSPLGAG